jgi:hypothetical protein
MSGRRGSLTGTLSLTLVLTLVLTSIVPAAQAAEGASVNGPLVRLTTVEGDGSTATVTGRLLEIDADSYVLAGSPRILVIRVPRQRVLRVERGERRSRLEGLGRGAVIGMASGALVGAGVGAASGGDDDIFGAKGRAVICGAALGALGTVLGAALGVANPGERWVSLTPGTSRVSLVTPTRGLGAGVTIRF